MVEVESIVDPAFFTVLCNGHTLRRFAVKDGLSEVELMDTPIKAYTGITLGDKNAKAPTDAEREQQLAKCAELRKMYNDAGVNIHIHKTPFGKSIMLQGANVVAAKYSGIRSASVLYGTYLTTGLLGSFAGLLILARNPTASGPDR